MTDGCKSPIEMGGASLENTLRVRKGGLHLSIGQKGAVLREYLG